jgi:hypothetical protein
VTYELFRSQFDGCAYVSSGLNCTCASEAMWLYRASQGRITTTSCHVRSLTGDRTGGTNLNEMQSVSTGYGITTGKLYQPIDFDQIASWVDTGRYGSHLNISYAAFVGTPYDRFRGQFKGNHDLFLSNRGVAPGTIRTGDPGATGFVDIPITLLKNAAGRLDLGGGTTLNAEFGGGKAYAYVTPADPATVATLYHFFVQGATPVWDKPNGTKISSIKTGSGSCRKYRDPEGRLWFQVVKPGSPINGRWLHAGPTVFVKPI